MFPVVESLSLRVKVQHRLADQDIVEGEVPLSPIQKDFLYDHRIDKHYYNQSVLLQCKTSINPEGTKQSLNAIVLHHDALRMVFENNAGEWRQYNRGANQGFEFSEVSISDDEALQVYCNKEQSSISLSEGHGLCALCCLEKAMINCC